MVTCVVNGRLEVLSLHIDPSLLATPDREMLQDLVTAAVNDGIRAAQRLMAEEMQKITGGIGLKLPGLG
jgi:DNA-binding protein YbaB